MTFTPLIGLTALETFTGTQLANFKELEAAYSTYWKASTSAADKKAELQNTISKNTQIADGLRKKQADVLVQQQASLAEFNVLASQRSTANETLGRASQAFKDAVNILRNSQPSFLELLSCIASTVVGVGADVAGIGKITGDWKFNFDFCTHGNPHLADHMNQSSSKHQVIAASEPLASFDTSMVRMLCMAITSLVSSVLVVGEKDTLKPLFSCIDIGQLYQSVQMCYNRSKRFSVRW